MKVLLIVYDNDSTVSYFPLGTAYIASAIRNAGHEVTIYNQDIYHHGEDHLVNYVKTNDFGLIGMSACGGYYQYKKIKKITAALNTIENRPPIILGGHLASPDPIYFIKKFNVDFVCIGEGETTIVDLINTIEMGETFNNVKGIAYNKDGKGYITEDRELIANVDEIPLPAYDMFIMEHYVLIEEPNKRKNQRSTPILSGRGCTFKCNFCYRMDKGFRPRSAESIISEMKYLIENYNITYFSFQDELLMNSVERTIELCKAFIDAELDVTWNCNGRLNYATKETLSHMKKAGCVFINYGIESIDDIALKNMNKALTVKQIVAGIENTLEAGISPGFNIIFGNIGENEKILEKDVEFLIKYDDHSQLRTIRPVTPYPGTPLFDIAIEKGLIEDIEDFYERKHTNSDLLTVNFTDMTDDEFYSALYKANKKLIDNYQQFIFESNHKTLDNLYINKDSLFRGFR